MRPTVLVARILGAQLATLVLLWVVIHFRERDPTISRFANWLALSMMVAALILLIISIV